jgi:glycosyltransferase involved in cell wall biosynthesis
MILRAPKAGLIFNQAEWSSNTLRILLLSAYDAHSHRYWWQGLKAAIPEHDWTVLTLPARHFAWRIRGNSLSWGLGEQEILNQPYDLLIATSMTDLSSLRGLVPHLTGISSLLYFHENQFAYPLGDQARAQVEPQIVSLYAALAADHLCFNSAYNRNTFLSGVVGLLDKLPDQIPDGICETLEQKSSILAVPLQAATEAVSENKHHHESMQILWNHRWEYDKAPERLLLALRKLTDNKIDFRLHVTGQQFRTVPDAFTTIRDEFHQHIDTWGYIQDRDSYQALLRRCDIVLSTALHDFQGLAILEAVQAGCLPVVPARLAYPELLPATCCYGSHIQSPEKESEALASHLAQLAQLHARRSLPAAPDISALSWANMASDYRDLLHSIAQPKAT